VLVDSPLRRIKIGAGVFLIFAGIQALERLKELIGNIWGR
jgi:hypothetical protein